MGRPANDGFLCLFSSRSRHTVGVVNIYTLNVGQGQFVVVSGTSEAIIVDTSIPLAPKKPIIHVGAALADILKGKKFIGLMITGFDGDHFNEIGVRMALNKYRPNWIMFPRYSKKTVAANAAFKAIEEFEDANSKFRRFPINLEQNSTRFYYKLSDDFFFEVFSPHADDMNSSNNCSLVCKITERATDGTYLVTGDCENSRWEKIATIFGDSIKCDVLSAPHHGSQNGITGSAMRLMVPDTVLISAGIDNMHGHPHSEALRIFGARAKNVWQTNFGEGQSLRTSITKSGSVINVNSFKYLRP
jgi:beta-lactamase superfamily II metal-dependent hydrolase